MALKTKTVALTPGLVTNPGVWSRNPEALSVAHNVDLSAPGGIQKRRGFSNNTLNSFSGTVWGAYSSAKLEADIGAGAILLACGPNTGGCTSLRVGLRTSTFNSLAGAGASQIVIGANYRPRLTTGPDGEDVISTWDGGEGGPQVLDYFGLTASRLGVPRGMGLDRQNTTLSGATGFLSSASACRYAVVFVIGDPTVNGAKFGSPGMTTVVTNSTGASADVATRVLLPKAYGTASTNLTADTVWVQVYRSVVQASSAGEPPSELALVYQKVIEAADIAAGYIAFTDSVPDILRGANLYTNLQTGEDGFAGRGFINSNEPPPVCADIATWANCLWAGEITDYASQELQLISVGGSGLVAGDTVFVGGVTYTAVAAAPAANQFVVFTTGTPSVNQRETALNLVDAINRSASNTTVWAYYTAGQAGLPGRIFLRGRLAVGAGWAVTVSRAAAWRVGTQDANNTSWSGLAFSKPLQPWAWPTVNRFEVGRGSARVLRLIPYRDSLFVFKEDGVWRVTGSDYSTFTVTEFDLTFRPVGRDSITVVDDAIYAWGTQGIAKITDGGVEYIDAPIKDKVIGAMKLVTVSVLETYAFAVGNQRDGVAVFFSPTANGNGSDPVACSNAFAFHVRSGSWSTWAFDTDGDEAIGYLCGTSNVYDHALALGVWQGGSPSGGYLHNERRAYTSADFTDPNMSNAVAPTMAATAYLSFLAWRPMQAGSLGAAQWLRARFEYAPAQLTTQGPPASISVSFNPDNPYAFPVSTAVPGTGPISDVPYVFVAPVDQDSSRSHALQVQVYESNAAGFMLVGLEVDYRDVSSKGVAR